MSTMNQRVIKLTYFPEKLPKFETQAEIDEWHRAIGRTVVFGMGDTGEDVVELVHAFITTNPLEIEAAYYPKIPSLNPLTDALRYVGSNRETLDAAWKQLEVKALDIGTPFVMGAVQGSDGKFGFHS